MTKDAINAKKVERRKLWEQMKAIHKKAGEANEGEGRSLTDDEQQQWDKMDADISKIDAWIAREERVMQEDALAVEAEQRRDEAEKTMTPDEAAEMRMFRKFLLQGVRGMDAEERKVMESMLETLPTEVRALAAASGGGSFTIPKQFSYEIERVEALYGGMFEACRVIRTATGGTMHYPKEDDTGQEGEWLTENTATTDQDTTVTDETFGDYTVSSKAMKVSMQLAHDTAFNLDQWLQQTGGRRIGVTSNKAFTNGDGSGKPTGLVPNVTSGVTAASATTVTADELIEAAHAVNPIYRRRPQPLGNVRAAGANPLDSTHLGWMFNDGSLKAIRKLKDSNGQYLWQPSVQAGVPDLLFGYPYIINPDMPAMTTGLKPFIFGDFSGYIIRKVEQSALLRLSERYAEKFQMAWILFERYDGKIINASKLRALTMA